ncbi:MAG: triose-phosphate isomerase [Candidatus Rokubacteria bacterium]|nr:triose-phosphate isomerase [Candidatus Rokubacteria bacterium]
MRTRIIVGNWKMHGGAGRARELAKAVRDGVRRLKGVEVVVCPPFTSLPAVAEVLAGSSVAWGAQNCYWEAEGAFTGEVSPAMLKELGCRLVIVGHSERRHLFRETDEEIRRKVGAAIAHGLEPVLCVGETAEERRQGLTFTVLEGQLRAGLAGLTPEELGRCLLAYEPVWAIGTGVAATPSQAVEAHSFLRGLLSELSSKELAQSTRILYGGSAKPENIQAFAHEAEIDGALVGGASLEAPSFIQIAKEGSGRGTGAPKE